MLKVLLPRQIKNMIKKAFATRRPNDSRTKSSEEKGVLPGAAPHWHDAQKYELHSAIEFMKSPFFKSVIEELNREDARVSKGYVDDAMMTEFFGNTPSLWAEFVKHITNKSVLEIGPCVATSLSTWDVASKKYVIEPLYENIRKYQQEHFGKTAFIDVEAYPQSAEIFIPELVGKIDGAILIRNCLDHTPQWPFIMVNLAHYAKKGAYLLLWNDLYHVPGYEEGHYDITQDADAFRRLIETLGFNITLGYENRDNPNLNYGCLAIRT